VGQGMGAPLHIQQSGLLSKQTYKDASEILCCLFVHLGSEYDMAAHVVGRHFSLFHMLVPTHHKCIN